MGVTQRAPFQLEIGSLVLKGFAPSARRACGEAFTREFTELAETRGLPDVGRGNAEWRLPALTIPAGAANSPTRVGRALARSLFDALQRAAGGV